MAAKANVAGSDRKHSFNTCEGKSKLQVFYKKAEILDAIAARRIIIIKGETGCGKTTQIPQFIYDEAQEKNQLCNIVVTQPRRIAAVTVATRVAIERNCPLGSLVGYQIGLDKKGNEDTRILYVTTGVLLQKLIKDKELSEFTHYIIDEIHERSQDMDFLLIILRNFLNTRSKEAKLVLMSATIDTRKFHKYLITYYNNKEYEAQVVNITDQKQFIVKEFFLEDLRVGKNRIVEASGSPSFDCPEISTRMYETAARIIQGLDKVCERTDDNDEVLDERPAVLVFLPGLHEIETMEETLNNMSSAEQRNSFWIKPLHSSITSEEQRAVFMNPPKNKRKIILSTNMAESSVTVTDIKYVIDFCLTKSLVTDPFSGCTSLELAWASKNSLKQRSGRVGRVAAGRVYRMITREFYQTELDDEAVPEIRRCPLESLVLKAKLLDMGPPEEVLALAMDPPCLENLVQAVGHLKQIGALLVCVGNRYDPRDGDLTFLGEVVAHLPIDVRLGKLVFLGCVFGVPEECIVMACAMGTKNLFSSPYGKNLETYNSKLKWADSTSSDCLAFLNAYREWRRRAVREKRDGETEEFTKSNYLQLKVLREVAEMEGDVRRRLKYHNLCTFEKQSIQTSNLGTESGDSGDHKLFFLNLAIAAAFYPNYFVRDSSGTQDEEKIAVNILDGHDPSSTVYLSGLPLNHPTTIYKNAIKKQFRCITNRLSVDVDRKGAKAYITFHRPISKPGRGTIQGKIEMGVYRAIKMNRANMKISIPLLENNEATKLHNKYLNQKKHTVNNVDIEFRRALRKLEWPWRKDKLSRCKEILEMKVSHVESPQKFWIQSSLKTSEYELKKLNAVLNAPKELNVLIKLPANANLPIGSLYVARLTNCEYDETREIFRRCRIVEKYYSMENRSREYMYTVLFVDYGDTQKDLTSDQIYDVDRQVNEEFFIDQLPHFAIECSLVKIQPTRRKLDEKWSSGWDREATRKVWQLFQESSIAKVYSVVNDVWKLKVILPNLKNEAYSWKNTINYKLIADGYAEEAYEDYISLSQHDELKKLFEENEANVGNYESDDDDDFDESHSSNKNNSVDFDNFELPKNLDNALETILKGPFSPLEMKIGSITRDTQGMPVKIERDSVNSILLDTDPSDPREKMLVAAYVGMNPTKDRLILRHTTIMPPQLPASPMLCCLLFAPMVELKVNPSYTRYSGALCGLGYDRQTKLSLFPSHDVSIVFDHEITEKELQLINVLRFQLNAVVNSRNGDTTDNLTQYTKKLRNGFKKLFLETEYTLQPRYHSTKPYHWGQVRSSRLRNPLSGLGAQHPAEDFKNVYRLIWAVWRSGDEEMDKEREAVIRNLKLLKEFSEGESSRNVVECELCKMSLANPTIAKMHLKVGAHRALSKQYSA